MTTAYSTMLTTPAMAAGAERTGGRTATASDGDGDADGAADDATAAAATANRRCRRW
jgi:hypothetical protein